MDKNNYDQFTDMIEQVKKIDEETWDTPISEGKWSVRQIIGHLYYWDKFNLETMLSKMENGANLPAFPDHHIHNERAMEHIEQYNDQVSLMNAFITTRKELVEGLQNIEEGVKFTIGGGKRKFTADSFIKLFIKHDTHHLKQMKL